MDDQKEKQLTHITGTFVIDAMPSFLNGAGISRSKEDKNFTIPKTFQDGTDERGRPYSTVYISAQSFKRMLNDTIVEETGWENDPMRPLSNNKDGHTKKASISCDPVISHRSDTNGYMKTAADSIEEENGNGKDGNGNGEAETESSIEFVKTVARTSPLATSILVGLRKNGWLGIEESFVHFDEGTPLPYSIKFANTPFTGIFCLNYARLCRFKNVGDRIELDESLVQKYLADGTIKPVGQQKYYALDKHTEEITKGKKKGDKVDKYTERKEYGDIYELTNAAEIRPQRAAAIINAYAHLRGGAKQAAFGTDVAPKVLILAGLTSGNPIFNTLFEDDARGPSRGKTVRLNVEALKEIAADYKDRLVTPIFVGIRTGFLQNEDEVRALLNKEDGFIITTPIKAAEQMIASLTTTAVTSQTVVVST